MEEVNQDKAMRLSARCFDRIWACALWWVPIRGNWLRGGVRCTRL
jgi:hypothetical protein